MSVPSARLSSGSRRRRSSSPAARSSRSRPRWGRARHCRCRCRCRRARRRRRRRRHGLQVGLGHRGAAADLVVAGARDRLTGLLVGPLDQTGAVERAGAGGAPHVRRADLRLGGVRDGLVRPGDRGGSMELLPQLGAVKGCAMAGAAGIMTAPAATAPSSRPRVVRVRRVFFRAIRGSSESCCGPTLGLASVFGHNPEFRRYGFDTSVEVREGVPVQVTGYTWSAPERRWTSGGNRALTSKETQEISRLPQLGVTVRFVTHATIRAV